MIRRIIGYLWNILKMPGRIKEIHEMTVESADSQARRLGRILDATQVTLERVRHLDGVTPYTGGPIRVVMLVHYSEAWISLEPVFRAMEADGSFHVTVATIARRFPGAPGFHGEDETHAALTARGVPHLRLPFVDSFESLDVLRALRPHAVFRQSQWDGDVPPGFSTRALSFTRLCLVPYETMNIVDNVVHRGTPTNTAVDSPFHRAAWRVFCANHLVWEAAEADGTLGGDRFAVTGHPKSIAITQAAAQWPLGGDGERPRIVWSAHHSIGDDWTRFGTFPSMARPMLDFAAAHPDLDVVFMPHPMLLTFPGHHHSPIDQTFIDDFLAEWSALSNTAVYQGVDYAGVLQASDALITDGLSMLVEYQLVGKPIVFVERSGHREFNEAGMRVIRGVHAIPDVDEALEAVRRFAAGEPDRLAEAQRAVVAELFEFDDPDRRIADLVGDGIRAEGLRGTAADAAYSAILQ
jgi:hypothetical protein